MQPIQVTCLLLFHEGKILATQRGAAMDLAGCWEFPGGKVELGESLENCLYREIREELGIEIEICGALTPVLYSYPTQVIQLHPFLATWEHGSLKLAEHSQSKWLYKEDLLALQWAPADLPIVQEVQSKWEDLVSFT